WSTLNEPGNIPGMSSSLPDDINALKRLLAEQEALNRALLEKLSAFTAHRAGYRRTGAAGPRADLKVCRAHPAVPPV
ncbi:hypothetical protein, partial [Escherichia coli]